MPRKQDVPFTFGDFILDPARRELSRGLKPVHLSPKALELLELLVRERARALAKDEIRERLWGDGPAGETGLPRVINEVRSALGDDAHAPTFVRTVHGFGYVFSGGVVEEPPTPTVCRLAWGERRIPLREGSNVVGRGPDAEVNIESARVSRRHARITVAGRRATLEDLSSKNGTFLNYRRLASPTDLQDGDEIKLGSAVVVFERGFSDLATTKSG